MPGPLGAAPGIMVGVGVGGAASTALRPILEPAEQRAWGNKPFRINDPQLIARLVAQGALDLEKDALPETKLHGYDLAPLRQLVYLAQTVPGFGELLQAWRRDPDGFADLWTHALRKNALDPRYLPALNDLRWDRLSLPVLALAIVRGLVKAPFPLPFTPPTGTGKVEAFPTSNLDAAKAARDVGFTVPDLFLQTAISGRPMGPESAAAATFRGILERVDYERAVLEGDVRGEWADAIFETARQIPSVANYVTAHLKAWITEAEMNAGVARHGMSPEDAHLLYLAAGRPAAPGQMATAAARGIDGPDGKPMDRAQFLKGIAESDIRPEWGPMLWESRFLYPPIFQLTRLVNAQTIDADTAADWATKDRYAPEVVEVLRESWAQISPTTAADPHVAKAQTHLWNATHSSYINREASPTVARNKMTLLGISPTDATTIIGLWDAERELIRKGLTPANVKKAFVKGSRNAQTGQPWTRDEALAFLVNLGWNVTEANDYLDIP